MEKKKLEMTLSTEVNGFKVEIYLESLESLEDAYLALLDAKARLHKIREGHKARQTAESLKEKASRYWTLSEGKRRVQGVDNTPIRIMLSLLDAYPETKKGATVASEAGVSQAAVSRYFTGTLGEYSAYFQECDEGWKLSDEGIQHLAEWFDSN